MWRGEVFGDLYWSSGDGSNRRVFLHLELDHDSEASALHRLQVGNPRLVGFATSRQGKYFDLRPPDGPSSWNEVLIRHRPPLCPQLRYSTASTFTVPAIPMQLTLDAPFRFPDARIRQFLFQSRSTRFEVRGGGGHSPWMADSNLPTQYVFANYSSSRFIIVVVVGHCQQERSPGKQCRPEGIWATVSARYSVGRVWEDLDAEISKLLTDTLHDCSQDHVLQWPDLRKRFKVYRHGHSTVAVTLSFTPCPLNPKGTLVLEASYIALR